MPGKEPSTQTSSSLSPNRLNVVDSITDIIERTQTESHNDLFKELNEIYHQTETKMFCSVLFKIMLIPFIKEKSKYSDRIIKFFYKVVTTMTKGEPAETNCLLSLRTLRQCLKYHPDARFRVRIRIANLVFILLSSLKDLNEIDESLKNQLKKMLLSRLRDENKQVRAQTACSLKYFIQREDPSSCEVYNDLKYHLNNDPQPEVRKAAFASLLEASGSSEFILEKINDNSEPIRKLAFHAIKEKYSIDEISVVQRGKIINAGLKDPSGIVRVTTESLLTEWSVSCQQDFPTLLAKLDLINNLRLCQLILSELFQADDTFGKVDLSMWQNKLIDLGNLSLENAFYWRFIVERFHTDPYCAEKIMPSALDLSNYLKRYMETYDDRLETYSPRILQQLLEIASYVNAEESGRRDLLSTVHEIVRFKHLHLSHIRPLLKLFYRHQSDNIEREFVEILQEILDSQKKVAEAEVINAPQMPSEGELRERKKQLGTLIHKRHKLVTEKDAAVQASDTEQADRLQEQINEISTEIDTIRSNINRSNKTIEPEATISEDFNTDYPVNALELAFTALIVHLRQTRSVSLYVRNFYDLYVTKAICCEQEGIRKLVLVLMTLVGLCSKEDAGKAMCLCIQALTFDGGIVQVSAFECIFDLVLRFGVDAFKELPEFPDSWETIISRIKKNVTLKEDQTNIELLIMHHLRSQNPRLVTVGVSGIIKLLLANRMCVPKMVTALLTLWSNPVNEATQTYQEITTWLPLFAKRGLQQALVLADAVVPCVHKVLSTGKRASEAEASAEKLVAFIAHCTNRQQLDTFMQRPELPHERITSALLEEIMRFENGPDVLCFAKALKLMNLEGCEKEIVSKMIVSVNRLLKVPRRGLSKSLKAFQSYLLSLPHNEIVEDADSEVSDQEGGLCSDANASSPSIFSDSD